jgi:transcription elongation factor GreA-like protein
MIKLISKLLTRNSTKIPLLYVNFNYKHYKQKGEVGSCILNLHPLFRKDEKIISKMNGLVDYIRENYDMGDIL